MHSKQDVSRRQFLKRSAIAAALGSSGAAFNGKLSIIGQALAADNYANLDDYKALVCVFLYGGSDSFDMYVPTDPAGYQEYADVRNRTLRVARDALLPTATELGFHPRLSRSHALFEQGNLAVIRNVGNLIAPLSREDFLAESPMIPFGLFAHDHQQEQWQKAYSSVPATTVSSGWGGRIADLMINANRSDTISPNVTIAGSNFWTPGNRVAPVSIHPRDGLAQLIYQDSSNNANNTARENTLQALFQSTGNHPMKRQVIADYNRAKSASRIVSNVLQQSPNFTTPINAGQRLASQLRMVARLIAAREQLGMRRQIFFVAFGSWDTHQTQAVQLPDLLTELDDGIGSFHDTLAELNLLNSVTTFTASDFGRSLTTNGDGTDHGWGGHYMVMGGAVAGRRLYGQMPSYALGGRDDAGNDGRIIPTSSLNQYGAILTRWLGITDTDLAQVFPDLSNFGSTWDSGLQFMG